MALDDSYSKVLLHLNSDFTDESGKTWGTGDGTPVISTSISKFGGGSLNLTDGASSISTGTSADFWLDGGNSASSWTIDCWTRFTVETNQGGAIIQFRSNNSNHWEIFKGVSTLEFQTTTSGLGFAVSWSPSINAWYHIALVKSGTNYKFFVNGTQIGSTYTSSAVISNYTGTLKLGTYKNDAGISKFLQGYLDEVRVSKGVARWTSAFTPPTSEYGSGNTGSFFSFF